jgi:hypothetical protein
MCNRLTRIFHEWEVLEVSPTTTNDKVSRSVNWVILAQMESVLETVCLHNHIMKQVLCVHLEKQSCINPHPWLLPLFIRSISIPGITMVVWEDIKTNGMAHQNIVLVQLESGLPISVCVGFTVKFFHITPLNPTFIGPCIIVIVEEQKTNLLSLANT